MLLGGTSIHQRTNGLRLRGKNGGRRGKRRLERERERAASGVVLLGEERERE